VMDVVEELNLVVGAVRIIQITPVTENIYFVCGGMYACCTSPGLNIYSSPQCSCWRHYSLSQSVSVTQGRTTQSIHPCVPPTTALIMLRRISAHRDDVTDRLPWLLQQQHQQHWTNCDRMLFDATSLYREIAAVVHASFSRVLVLVLHVWPPSQRLNLRVQWVKIDIM